MTAAIDYVRILWDFLIYEDELEKADVIICFGSNDMTLAERASRLFLDGMAPYLLFSGGLGKGTEGVWAKTEAETFRDIAIKLGVDESRIIVENRSANTGENINFSKQLLKEKGIAANRAIVVHKPFMGRRVYAALRKQWPELDAMIVPYYGEMEAYLEQMKALGVDENFLFCTIAGDFQRMDVFAKQGYQIPQDIPPGATKAYEELCKLGYTKFVLG